MGIDQSLFERLGGQETYDKVHKIFYDKAYAHPWLSKFFTDKPQEHLENQQTDFMMQLMGGPKRYAGKSPKDAHKHIFITDELYELRAQLLAESIQEAGISNELKQEWIKADATFQRALVKNSADECVRAYPTQPILNFTRP